MKSLVSALNGLARVVALLCVILAGVGMTCDEPVWRYAMASWKPRPYDVVLEVPENASSEASMAGEGIDLGTDSLQKRLLHEENEANIRLTVIKKNITSRVDSGLATSNSPPTRTPRLSVLHPRTEEILWSRPATPQNVTALLDSSVRRALVEHLMKGDCAVWIFRPGGDADKDRAARKVLAEALPLLADRLTASLAERDRALTDELWADPDALGPRVIDRGPVTFTLLDLDPADPGEALLDAQLRTVEPDLHEYAGEPMVFPVFGRGRALYALVGRGITPYNVDAACRFLTDPCSCLAKEENPGMDLLLRADWDEALTEDGLDPRLLTGTVRAEGEASPTDEVAVPAVEVRRGESAPAPRGMKDDGMQDESAAPGEEGGPRGDSAPHDPDAGLGRNLLVVAGGLVSVVLLLSVGLAILRRKG